MALPAGAGNVPREDGSQRIIDTQDAVNAVAGSARCHVAGHRQGDLCACLAVCNQTADACQRLTVSTRPEQLLGRQVGRRIEAPHHQRIAMATTAELRLLPGIGRPVCCCMRIALLEVLRGYLVAVNASHALAGVYVSIPVIICDLPEFADQIVVAVFVQARVYRLGTEFGNTAVLEGGQKRCCGEAGN